MKRMGLDIVNLEENTLKFVAHVDADLPEKYEQVVHLPEKGRREREAALKARDVIQIINHPDPIMLPKGQLERLGQKVRTSRCASWSRAGPP